jgi:hypothetical protein
MRLCSRSSMTPSGYWSRRPSGTSSPRLTRTRPSSWQPGSGALATNTSAGGRGKARPENTRARMRAEAFEEALSRGEPPGGGPGPDGGGGAAGRAACGSPGRQAGPRAVGRPQRPARARWAPPPAQKLLPLVPSARPGLRSSARAPLPWVPAARRSGIADSHRPATAAARDRRPG